MLFSKSTLLYFFESRMRTAPADRIGSRIVLYLYYSTKQHKRKGDLFQKKQGQKLLVNMHTKQERTLFDEAPKYGSRLFWLPDPFRYRLDLTILDLTILDCGSVLVPFWFRLCSVLVPDLTILYYTILDLTILDCGSVLVPLWFRNKILLCKQSVLQALPKTNGSKPT